MYRALSVGLLVSAFTAFAVLPALVAADKDKDTKDTKAATTFDGKIAKVDASKRMITLSDVKTTLVTDKDKAPTDKTTTTDKDKGRDTTNVGHYTFEVSADAKITLDGKTATIDKLESGQFVHVWSTQGDKTDKKTAADKPTTDKDLHLKTDRIEAFTKNPTDKKDK